MELLAQCDATRLPHTKRMQSIVERNAKVRKDRKKEILDQTEDIAGSLHYISGHVETTTLERIMKEIVKEHN
jgi:hypothetical protein